eukprot:gb/GEZN01009008.1/.p1 GENE.gb/GEZN01009008.1/~~gb/GEZN01009008.1/.p1  ORF type:complete len:345 (+),score=69.02 gb/GEZN01009008.1/:47-1081(+)
MLQELPVKKAVHALCAFLKAKQDKDSKSSLIEEDPVIILTITLKKAPAKTRTMPYRVPLPHSLYPEEESEICVITKDPQNEWEVKVQSAKNVKGISVKTLKTQYRQYKDRRALLASFDLFLADDRVIPLLPPLLGKEFYNKKKQPLPVVLKNEQRIVKEIQTARNLTAFFLSGEYCAVRIAKASFEEAASVANILVAMEFIAQKIPHKWKGIQALHIKTHDSVALPIYTSLPISQRISTDGPKPESVLLKQDSKKKTIAKGSSKKDSVPKGSIKETIPKGSTKKKDTLIPASRKGKSKGKSPLSQDTRTKKRAPPANGDTTAKKEGKVESRSRKRIKTDSKTTA